MARHLKKGPWPLVSCRLDLAEYATALLVGQHLRLGANGVGLALHLDMNVIRFIVPLAGWPTGRGPNGRAARAARCRAALDSALERFFVVSGGGALVVNSPKRPDEAARAAITEVAARIAVACTTTHSPPQVARRQRDRK